MKRALICLSIALATSLSVPASADVVGPPPTSCPAGSTPSTCHGGPHCTPNLCGTDADCTGGTACKDVAYCVTTINCSGLLPPDADPSQFEKDAVDAACGACSGGQPCKTLKVCIAGGTSSSSSSGGTTSSSSSGGTTSSSSGTTETGAGESGGCSCDLAGGEGPLGAAFAAFAATAALAFARRRREHA